MPDAENLGTTQALAHICDMLNVLHVPKRLGRNKLQIRPNRM